MFLDQHQCQGTWKHVLWLELKRDRWWLQRTLALVDAANLILTAMMMRFLLFYQALDWYRDLWVLDLALKSGGLHILRVL